MKKLTAAQSALLAKLPERFSTADMIGSGSTIKASYVTDERGAPLFRFERGDSVAFASLCRAGKLLHVADGINSSKTIVTTYEKA